MGLLIDGQTNRLEDLRNYENGILDLASTENIDLTGKMALAEDEIGILILHFLLKQVPRDLRAYSVMLPGESDRRRKGVSDVVVTPELKRWVALTTIEHAYADAYSNQLNDRYAAKLAKYEALVEEARRSYFEGGVGISVDPVGRASIPKMESIAGVGGATTYYVRVSWTNRAGQEGLPSTLDSFSTSNGTQLQVSATGAPGNVLGWNLYAGYTPDALTLQNDAPIPIGTPWVAPTAGLSSSGRSPGGGQTADRYVVNYRMQLRG